MKFLDEYRDRRAASKIAAQLGRAVTKPYVTMEVCGLDPLECQIRAGSTSSR